MKKALIIIFTIFTVSFTYAQDDTLYIEKSTDKVMIGGQIYFVHIVKQNETLFSLSKAYEVSQKDIAKENPEIFLGLQIGQALKIPSFESDMERKDKKSFIYHKVKKGQTLYSLSKKYDVTQEDIIVCNPTVRYGININQIVKIPKSKYVVQSIQKIPTADRSLDTMKLSKEFIYHHVAKQETVYSLVRQYDITEEILYEYNPKAKAGLKVDQVLKIPVIVSAETETVLFQKDSLDVDTFLLEKRALVAFSDSALFTECYKIKPTGKEDYQVALMLPLYLEKNDEEFYVDSSEYDELGKKIYEQVFYSPNYIYPKSMHALEFYEGILLAIDSLKQTGLSISLNVYDTKNDADKVRELLLDPDLENMDLIIGPIYYKEVKLVSEFSKKHGITMVSPLLDDINILKDNSNIIQVYPSYGAQIEEFAKYVSRFQDKNIIIVHNGESFSYSNIELVKDRIFSYLSIDTLINNIQFKEVVFKDSVHVFKHALDIEKGNVFIIPSNDEAFVTDVITNLNTLKTFGGDIQVVGLSRWQRFGNIDPSYFFNLELSIAAPFFIDYSKTDVKSFVLKYRRTYRTEPRQMAIHGYDIGMYFFSALRDFGVSFPNCMINYNVDLLQAKYRFVRWYEKSGYENIGVDMVKYYEGYNISRINDFELTPTVSRDTSDNQ